MKHFFPISGICWFLHNLVIVWEMFAINILRSDALRSASSVTDENKNLFDVRKRVSFSYCRLVIYLAFQM